MADGELGLLGDIWGCGEAKGEKYLERAMASSARSRSSFDSSVDISADVAAVTVSTLRVLACPVDDDARNPSRDGRGDKDGETILDEDGRLGFHSGDKFQESALTTSGRMSCRLQASRESWSLAFSFPLPLSSAFACIPF